MSLELLCGTGLLASRPAMGREGLLPWAMRWGVTAGDWALAAGIALPALLPGCCIGLAIAGVRREGFRQGLTYSAKGLCAVAVVPALVAAALTAPIHHACLVGLRLIGLLPVLGLAALGAIYGLVKRRLPVVVPPPACPQATLSQPLVAVLLELTKVVRSGSRGFAFPSLYDSLVDAPDVRRLTDEIWRQIPLSQGDVLGYLNALLPVPSGEPAVRILRSLGRTPMDPRKYGFIKGWAEVLEPLLRPPIRQVVEPRKPMSVTEQEAIVEHFQNLPYAVQKREVDAFNTLQMDYDEMANTCHWEIQGLLERVRALTVDPSGADEATDEDERDQLIGDAEAPSNPLLLMVDCAERTWLSDLEQYPDPHCDPTPPKTLHGLLVRRNAQMTRILAAGPAAVALQDFVDNHRQSQPSTVPAVLNRETQAQLLE